MTWNPHDPNMLATGSGNNIVTLIDMRKGKQLKTIKNRQTVGPIQSLPVWHATLTQGILPVYHSCLLMSEGAEAVAA